MLSKTMSSCTHLPNHWLLLVPALSFVAVPAALVFLHKYCEEGSCAMHWHVAVVHLIRYGQPLCVLVCQSNVCLLEACDAFFVVVFGGMIPLFINIFYSDSDEICRTNENSCNSIHLNLKMSSFRMLILPLPELDASAGRLQL